MILSQQLGNGAMEANETLYEIGLLYYKKVDYNEKCSVFICEQRKLVETVLWLTANNR